MIRPIHLFALLFCSSLVHSQQQVLFDPGPTQVGILVPSTLRDPVFVLGAHTDYDKRGEVFLCQQLAIYDNLDILILTYSSRRKGHNF